MSNKLTSMGFRKAHAGVILSAAAALSLLPSAAMAADFIPASGDFNVGSNWTVNRVPGSTSTNENANIPTGKTATLASDLNGNQHLNSVDVKNNAALYINTGGRLRTNGAVNVYQTLDVTGTLALQYYSTLNVQNGGQATFHTGSALTYSGTNPVTVQSGGVLKIEGGTLTDGGGVAGWTNGGTINQSGGTVSFPRELTISGSNAVYNLSGGSLSTTGGQYRKTYIGDTNNNGTLNVSGGTANLDELGSIGESGHTGKVSVSGGALTMYNTHIGSQGTFEVVGSSGAITLKNYLVDGNRGAGNANGPLDLKSGGVLKFVIGASGISPINIVSGSASNTGSISWLAGTLDLDLNNFTPAANTTYDLVNTNVTVAGAIDITNLTLASGDSANWSFALANSGKTLQATYVPEPASLGLVSLGGLMLMARRRRNVA